MRYVFHSKDVFLGDQPYTHLMYVQHLIAPPQFNCRLENVRAAVRIETAVMNSKPGDYYELHDADYALLAAENSSPSNGFPLGHNRDSHGTVVSTVSLAKMLLSHIDAIDSAVMEKPKTVA